MIRVTVSFGLSLIVASGLGVRTTLAAEAENMVAPGGVWWQPKSRITIQEKISLAADTQWTADELFLNATVVTNGNALNVLARRMVFGSGAKIIAFESVPSPVPDGPAYPTGAKVGGNGGGKGDDGAAGKEGLRGNFGFGAEGPLPKPINIFAGIVEGKSEIIAAGQDGGKGGKGGPGQDGGTGGPGSPGEAHIIGKNTKAGKGGPGGSYGKGGKGGRGGQGGPPVPACFLLATSPQTGQPQPVVICRPGKGGAVGEAGRPGKAGQGGPGGAGDVAEFKIFFTIAKSVEPNGPGGDPGQGCPFPSGSAEEKANCTLGDGAIGADGQDLSPEKWKQLVGREKPDFLRAFSEFEAKRFELMLGWYDFHWWRLFERLARTSVALMTSTAQAADPVQELLRGEFQRASVEVVSERWSRSFVKALQLEKDRVRGRDRFVEEKIDRALKRAEPFSKIVKQAAERGAFTKADVQALQMLLAEVKQDRARVATAVAGGCESYIKEVLQSKTYLDNLSLLSTHFEIPACRTAEMFLTAEGVQTPIELALSYQLTVTEPVPKGVVSQKSVPPDLKKEGAWFNWATSLWKIAWSFFPGLISEAFAEGPRQFEIIAVPIRPSEIRPIQIHEFLPSKEMPTVVGSLGVHKGYLLPKAGDISLENLGSHLRYLAALLGKGAP